MSAHLSRHVNEYLDTIGFSQQNVKERIYAWNLSSVAKTISTQNILKNNQIEKIFVGSRREGIGIELNNDIDILQIDHSVVCLSDLNKISERCKNKTLFHIKTNGVPKGYCYLKLSGESKKELEYALIKRANKGTFISSFLYKEKNEDVFFQTNGWIARNTVYTKKSGPAIQKYVKKDIIAQCFKFLRNLNNEMDIVKGFPCMYSSLLTQWFKRERPYDWPSQSMIEATLQAYVVPAGIKKSEYCQIQWRISFTQAEIYLVQNFNDTQRKVFVLIRMVAKFILTPICEDISSYVIKNVMFWSTESMNIDEFKTDNLIDRLKDTIIYLQSCVKKRMLKNYMIPERNLFHDKITKKERKLILASLSRLLENGVNDIDQFFHTEFVNSPTTDIVERLYLCSIFDKVRVLQMSLFSSGELARFCDAGFYCNWWLMLYLYHFAYVLIPYFIKFGREGIDNPLNIKLSETEMRPLLPASQPVRKVRACYEENEKATIEPTSVKVHSQGVHTRTTEKTLENNLATTDSSVEHDLYSPAVSFGLTFIFTLCRSELSFQIVLLFYVFLFIYLFLYFYEFCNPLSTIMSKNRFTLPLLLNGKKAKYGYGLALFACNIIITMSFFKIWDFIILV